MISFDKSFENSFESSFGNLFEKSFGNTLIVGAGPAAIFVAVHAARGWCDQLGLVNRKGPHTARLASELEQHQYTVTSNVQGEQRSHLSGTARLTHFYQGFEQIDDKWQTIILCTPSDSYFAVMNALQIDRLQQVKTIVLISPSIGSNLLVQSQLQQAKNRIAVISLSNYMAATKFESSSSSLLSVYTKAIKKRIYLASSKEPCSAIQAVQSFIEGLGIDSTVVRHPIEAESRNITTYVHPPFFINTFSLQNILSQDRSLKSMYKLYPEGPITQHAIRTMVQLWKEVSAFTSYFGAEPLNLLKFLNDDNYPVHELTLSRTDIETFMELEPVKQEYLLYIRYASILIDPFSTPDEKGKYFDFSAVPYKPIYTDEVGKWVIPRIPFEDYKKLKLIYGLATKLKLPMPQTLALIELFEQHLNAFIAEKGEAAVAAEMFTDTTALEVEAIFSEIRERSEVS
ncbi:opine metallophore biosynthesis dehydrogenase [Paenibacillus sp. 481]|uniref:opine metallophore biosynthesis dehydrogenase n=1 Tax=Paenibacillus sp. 481 TaxID=2835869 RepID=UPI001E561137|nr:opine metallophore biosynthesis dehydrogenase [Paenibacillus sp. 481]UHA73624.1 opine metallophore biosynthesis dehydrogenase [Paenibacillus sp. 481]